MAETVLAKMAVEIAANTAGFQRELAATNSKLNSFSSSTSRAVKGIAGAVAAAFAGISLTSFIKQVIDVSSEFQKFEAVLVNTLGSQSAAQIALRDIEKFAAKTPFSVAELTGSFVKLANQGFKPTTDELRKLGDLAASTGKGFDQLSEAIIDAQTGEFERLKEFGIRASKSGDQVKFTFKGVETQTKFTATAIRDYVLALGDAQGVSGAMAAISGTLGGQISNLGDSWTTFLKVVGDGNKGILAGATQQLSKMLAGLTDLIKTRGQIQEETKVDAQSTILDDLKDLEKITGDVESSAIKLISRLEGEKEALVDLSRQYSINTEDGLEQIESLNRQALVIDAQITAINDYTAAQLAQQAAAAESVKKHDAETAALKKLAEARKESFAPDSIGAYNHAISTLNKELEKTNVNDTSRIRILSAQIAGYQEAIENVERLKKSFEDFEIGAIAVPDLSGLLNPIKEIQTAVGGISFTSVSDATAVMTERIEENLKRMAEKSKEVTGEMKTMFIDFGSIVSSAASGIGEALGSAIGGGSNFGKSLLKVLGSVLVQLGQMLITAGIGVEGFKKALKSLNGYVAIAAGIALVAIGTAVGASIKGLGGGAGGGAGAGGAGGGRVTSNVESVGSVGTPESRIVFDAKFEIAGNKLVAVVDNTMNKKQRTG